MTEVTKATRYF